MYTIPKWQLIINIQRLYTSIITFFFDIAFLENKVTSDVLNSTLAIEESRETLQCYNTSESREVIYQDVCYLHKYDSLRYASRGIAEVIVVLWSVIYLAIAAREITYVPFKIYLQSLGLMPSRVVFLLGCFFAICVVPCRLACYPIMEHNFAILAMSAIPNYFLFFCRGFKSTGPFVTMIYRMLAADLLRFGIIYFISFIILINLAI